MRARDIVRMWRESERNDNLKDKGYARLSWNMFLDSLERDEIITRKQADRLPTPKECK